MILNQRPDIAIAKLKESLWVYGSRVGSKSWQSVESPDDTLELLNESIRFPLDMDLSKLKETIRPNLPWADVHFEERVSGIPHNPPPSHEIWPFTQSNNQKFRKDEKFSHTYPERFWPKYAGGSPTLENILPSALRGIRYNYGDLQSVINLLVKDPTTRQAYLPIWFPEDTGAEEGQRVPCTLGYHFIYRNQMLYINYYIRSCDIIRHMRDDLYLAARLCHYVANYLEINLGIRVIPGALTMHITSLHCFYKERHLLKLDKY
jgi:hypothetical protein